jgi:hypothetical protein
MTARSVRPDRMPTNTLWLSSMPALHWLTATA